MSLPVSKGLLPEFLRATRSGLGALGFVKRTEEIFTLPVAEDVLGWLGLPRVIDSRAKRLCVALTVGVRHQTIEGVISSLLQERRHPYIPPTVSTNIGYIMPDDRYKQWCVHDGDDVSPVVRDLVDSVHEFALPFMHHNAQLTQLCSSMHNVRIGIPGQMAYRLPVCCVLLGKPGDAKLAVDTQLAALRGGANPAADRYRKFASALADRFWSAPFGERRDHN